LSESSRVTAEKLSRAEAERRFWKAKHEAAVLRNEVETMSPDMFAGLEQKRLGTGKPTPLDRAAEAHTRGIELNMFQRGLNGGEQASSTKPTQLDPNIVIQTKAAIVKALATSHSPQEIETYLAKISPFLDVAMLAGSDPLTQSMLYAKIMGSNQQQTLTVKDVVELVATINELKGSQPTQATDAGQLANALATAMRSGVDAAKTNNNGVDVNQLLNMQQQSHDRLLQTQQQHFEQMRELQQQQPTLVDSLKQYRELQGLVGSVPDRPEVAMKKLDLQAATEAREHAYRLESAKEKRQTELIKGITGGLSRALENPVVRELGRSVGSKIGVTDNPLAAAQTKAAQQQVKNLADPLRAVYGFTCAKCRQRKTFSELRMGEIKETGGRWVCDTPGCGEVYSLGDLPTGPK